MAFAFKKLVVYQKSVDFADRICEITENFPRGYGFLCDQLNRVSLSIAANIAEGNGHFTKPDRRNFFGIARGSIQECVLLFELTLRRRLLAAQEHEKLKSHLEEISRMLSGLINNLDDEDSSFGLPGQSREFRSGHLFRPASSESDGDFVSLLNIQFRDCGF